MFFYQFQTTKHKSLANILLFVLIANLVFSFILIPTKEAKAIPVEIVIDGPFSIWGALDNAWKAIDTGLQELTKMFSGLSAITDLWEKADTIAGRIVRAALLIALHQILGMITNEVIKWVNGGGSPKFVSDWGGFLRDAAQQAGGSFLDTLSGGFLCNPFAFQIKLALMPTGYYQQSRCTLSDMGNNLQNFFANFTNGGGWGTWLQVSQPNNNFFGLYGMALDEKTKQEAEAREKAKNEALSGGGFLSDKKCDQCRIENLISGSAQTLSGFDNCDEKKAGASSGEVKFTCTHYTIQTPASVVQNEVQQVVDSARKLLQDQIASLSSSLGVLQPYITAIAGALINRVIQTGLSKVAQAIGNNDPSYGPTFSNPYTPIPAPEPISIPSAPIQIAAEVQSAAPTLVSSLNLLKENLETQLLEQQQKNMAVLNSIKDKQTQTLEFLKDMVTNNCALPSWVSSQIISDTESVQTIKLTADSIGVITIEKTTLTTETGTSITVEAKETIPAIMSQLNALQMSINKTNQRIESVDSAITANQVAMDEADAYSDLFQSIGYSADTKDVATISAAGKKLEDAYAAALSSSQAAFDSTRTNLISLLTDGQEKNIKVVQEAIDTENNRAGLESQLSSIASKPAEAQSALNACAQ